MIGEDQEIFDGQNYRVNAYDANDDVNAYGANEAVVAYDANDNPIWASNTNIY